MSLSKSLSLGISGIEGHIIEIEVDTVKGLPGFTIVGLPDSTIRESRERIRSAIENSGFEFPPHNFIVNLAPAGFKKQGANFDLPVALSILHRTGQIGPDPAGIPSVGELSLDGRIKPVRGVISMVIRLLSEGHRSFIVPQKNRNEAAAAGGLKIYPVNTIQEAIDALSGKIRPFEGKNTPASLKTDIDFSQVLGQETAKRALEIAAAGQHNILLYGTPGSGKTMLASRIVTIMPELTREQSIETTMIHSAAGLLDDHSGLIRTPPFRSPHHTASDVSLTGGGHVPSVGEVSLAHNGVLFMDELIQFKSHVIQALRQPLEDRVITVSRAAGSQSFPSDVLFIGSSNPCQCGYLFDDEIPCNCSPAKIRHYFNKISGPILDRIDMEVQVDRVDYKSLMGRVKAEPSRTIRERVYKARSIQEHRFRGKPGLYNSQMTTDDIREHCKTNEDTTVLLTGAIQSMRLSARSFFKILKISRTIADLEGVQSIRKEHVLEALSYKNLQRNYSLN